ncbi:MAG: hypothetical protein ACLPRE_10830 [Limisphaerales bacterium]
MDSRPISLRLSSFLALAALGMVPFVEAQPAATNAWKPIIFSSPAENEISSNPISPSTQPLAPADFRGLFQDATPISSFNDFGPAPMPSGGGRIQKSSEDRQDWIFETPAEIMGVSSDQILQTGKRNENGQQENLSPMERYLEGRNPSARFDQSGNPSRSRNFWGRGNDQTNSDDSSSDLMNGDPDDVQSPLISSQFPDTAPGNTANPNTDSAWSKLFGAPAPQSTPNASTLAQQQAELNQFQQLLNPGSMPVTAATIVPDNTSAFKPQNTLPITDSAQPLVNPIGASFAPLNSGIGQPAALTPLPTITRQAGIPAVTTPSWAPQPAPWMSQNPQPFAIPQRKF